MTNILELITTKLIMNKYTYINSKIIIYPLIRINQELLLQNKITIIVRLITKE